MVSIDGVLIPMTVDTGAKVALVPRELIPSECLSGRKQLYFGVDNSKGHSEGELANVTMHILDEARNVEVVAVPGERLGWVETLRMSVTSPEDRELLVKLDDNRLKMTDEEVSYIPPRRGSKGFQGAVWPLSGGGEESVPQAPETVDSVTEVSNPGVCEKPQVDLPVVPL